MTTAQRIEHKKGNQFRKMMIMRFDKKKNPLILFLGGVCQNGKYTNLFK